jgi:4-hydroxythreonine-4-phosphate dehydrogenase
LIQEWSRDDELRPSDLRPGESRMGSMKITDLAGRGTADVAPEDRLVVGISLGDYNGIGPEVILKALQYNQLQRVCTTVIYGSMRVLNRYRNLLNLKDWNLNGIQNVGQASHKMTNVITCWNENARSVPAPEPVTTPQPEPSAEPKEGQPEAIDTNSEPVATAEGADQFATVESAPPVVVQAEAPPQPAPLTHEIQPGKVTPEAGQAALACLERAVEDLKAGKLDALITGPINKHNIQSETFKFPGHTEYLAQAFGVPDDLMFMVSETLRVGVVTGHVPLAKVRQHITRNAIHQKLTMMMQSLRVDFGIEKPRIAVLGLNPHAGENGLLGNEEQETISPVIEDWRKKGELVYGPFPADGFFGTRGYRKFDAVLAMYHDQGLTPFKVIAFEEGVNFTAGLPIVRTSPDHGTAYDIAGKNLADETSMTQAIYLACDVARRRKEHKETEANALKK